jgi:hypothetical protein
MAKILPSDLHPDVEVFHSLGQGVPFTIKGQNKTAAFETDDQATIIEARVHPWLTVEEDAPEAQPEAEQAEVVQPVAIEAGKNQKQESVTGGVAETIASGQDSEVEEVPVFEVAPEPDEVFEDTDE